jgi:hypothetical protein
MERSTRGVSQTPHAAAGVDVAAILGADGLPNGMLWLGMVYDVDTGLVELTVAPE